MNSLIGITLAALLFQSSPRPHGKADSVWTSCVPTEPMPILGSQSRPVEKMPVFWPDSIWRNAMPTIKLIPCYLVDSLQGPRVREAR